MEYRFSSRWRIRTTAEFQQVYSKRRRIRGKCYLLYYMANSLGHPRLGVVASKRNVKKAVVRNRVRRIVKETFRIQKSHLPAFDFVFIVMPTAAEANKQELHECVNQLFEQLAKQS